MTAVLSIPIAMVDRIFDDKTGKWHVYALTVPSSVSGLPVIDSCDDCAKVWPAAELTYNPHAHQYFCPLCTVPLP
jgi:hypothetical protein